MELSIKINSDNQNKYEKKINKIVETAKRHQKSNEIMDELAIITNYLKYDTDDLNTSIFTNPDSVICPELTKSITSLKDVELKVDLDIGKSNIYKILKLRASRRDYSYQNISLESISNILYYSYGKRGIMRAYNKEDFALRFSPSAGGLQSNDIYLIINKVSGLEKGLYYYNFEKNCLSLIESGYMRNKLLECCINQEFIQDASAIFIIVANLNRIKWKYGKKSYRFAHVDTGILSENLHLLTTANKLRSCMIAGFNDDKINNFLNLDGEKEFVTLMISVGTSPWNLERNENVGKK